MVAKSLTSPSGILSDIYGQKPPLQFLARLDTEDFLVHFNNTYRDSRLIVTLISEAQQDG